MKDRLIIMALMLTAILLSFYLAYTRGYHNAEIQAEIECIPYPDLFLVEAYNE